MRQVVGSQERPVFQRQTSTDLHYEIARYLFVIAVVLAAFGYSRGWFTVNAASHTGHTEVQLRIDDAKVADDARAATTRLHGAIPGADHIEGRITAIDAAARALTLQTGTQQTVHHVSSTVPITRDGTQLPFAELRTDMRVRLSFDANATAVLVGVVILP